MPPNSKMPKSHQIAHYIALIAFCYLIGNGIAEWDNGLIPFMAVAGLGIMLIIYDLQKDYRNKQ